LVKFSYGYLSLQINQKFGEKKILIKKLKKNPCYLVLRGEGG
jgi:hypothetical protein